MQSNFDELEQIPLPAEAKRLLRLIRLHCEDLEKKVLDIAQEKVDQQRKIEKLEQQLAALYKTQPLTNPEDSLANLPDKQKILLWLTKGGRTEIEIRLNFGMSRTRVQYFLEELLRGNQIRRDLDESDLKTYYSLEHKGKELLVNLDLV